VNRYLVISYDPDQDQAFGDYVLADSHSGACLWVRKYRPYAEVLDAIDKEVIGIMEATPEEDIRESMQFLVDDFDEEEEVED
jgi:hypothetical protein